MKKLLVFSATWCGPCKAMKPVVTELEAKGLEVQRIDVDADEKTTTDYKVMSMPTFVVLEDGKEVRRAVGAMPKAKLEALIAG